MALQRGHIYRAFLALCAEPDCPARAVSCRAGKALTLAEAEAEMRGNGWSKTKDGWRCPQHAGRSQKGAGS